MEQLIEKYIRYCITTDNKLNVHVPNSHIGITFSEVYEYIGYFNSGEHHAIFEGRNFEQAVSDVFSDVELTDDIVHDAYQKLREKRNELRNLMKLLIVVDNGEIMNKRVKHSMFEIYKEFSNRVKIT